MEKSFFPKNCLEVGIIRYIDQALTDPNDSKQWSHDDRKKICASIEQTVLTEHNSSQKIRANNISSNIQYEGEEVISVYQNII